MSEETVIPQQVIPFKELNASDLGNREIARANSKAGEQISQIKLSSVVVMDEYNAREESEYGDIEGLSASIEDTGQAVPGIVAILKDGKFLVIEGHRRIKALNLIWQRTGIEPYFKAIVRSKISVEERILLMFTTQDNEKLKPHAIARLINRLINLGYSQTEVAKKIGKTAAYVSQMLAYNSESVIIKKQVEAGNISVSAVLKLQKDVPNVTEREELINKAVNVKNSGGQKLSTVKAGEVYVQLNSFKEFKKFVARADVIRENIPTEKQPVYDTLLKIINNEMTAEQIEQYFYFKNYNE